MASAAGHKKLADIIAELEDPAPKDVDPEAFEGGFDRLGASDEEGSSGGEAGREHYETVGESNLRKPTAPTVGSQYAGSTVSRSALNNDFDNDYADVDEDDPFAKRPDAESDLGSRGSASENDSQEDGEDYDEPDYVNGVQELDLDDEIDSDKAFGVGDEEQFKKKGFTFRGSNKLVTGTSSAEASEAGSRDDFGGFDDDEDLAMAGLGQCLTEDQAKVEAVSDEEDDDGEDEEADSNDEFSDSDLPSEGSNTKGTSPEEQEVGGFNRAALREMMAAEQKSVVASISEATKADAAKGMAVKQQYATFDTLISTRIQLRGALVSMNSLAEAPSATESPATEKEAIASAAQSAESAALSLFNSITALQQGLQKHYASKSAKSEPQSRKRPFSATHSTPTSSVHEALDSLSSTSYLRHRSTLTKWSQRTQSISTLPSHNKLTQAPTQQPLTSVLDTYLQGHSLDRLIQRTQTPRSCAPLHQAASSTTTTTTTATNDQPTNPTLFDDADFYALLLRELIEHKKSYPSTPNATTNNTTLTTFNASHDPALAAASSSANPTALLRASRQRRKNVDVKASKGRKMRYTVHEKLVDFMAPQEDGVGEGVWERGRAEELFAGLFGRKRGVDGVGSGVSEGGEEDGVGEMDREVEGLKLFAGA